MQYPTSVTLKLYLYWFYLILKSPVEMKPQPKTSKSRKYSSIQIVIFSYSFEDKRHHIFPSLQYLRAGTPFTCLGLNFKFTFVYPPILSRSTMSEYFVTQEPFTEVPVCGKKLQGPKYKTAFGICLQDICSVFQNATFSFLFIFFYSRSI